MPTITLPADDLDHIRRMLRDELAGLHEQARDLADFGRHDELPETHARLAAVERLVAQVGLY